MVNNIYYVEKKNERCKICGGPRDAHFHVDPTTWKIIKEEEENAKSIQRTSTNEPK